MARSFVAASTQYLDAGTGVPSISTGPNARPHVSAWVNLTNTGTARKLVGKWDSTSAREFLLQTLATDKVLFAYADTPGNTVFSMNGATSLVAGRWYHIFGRWTGTAIEIYVNGALDGTAPVTNTPRVGTLPLRIGRDSSTGGSDQPHNGKLAEVGIWNPQNANFSDLEILALASGASPIFIRPQSLKGYWPLLGDSPEPDYSGNRNSATNTGTTYTAHPAIGSLLMPHWALAGGAFAAGSGAYLSQEALEALRSNDGSGAMLSQAALEVLASKPVNTAALSQEAVEVLRSISSDPVRLSQLAIEILVPAVQESAQAVWAW